MSSTIQWNTKKFYPQYPMTNSFSQVSSNPGQVYHVTTGHHQSILLGRVPVLHTVLYGGVPSVMVQGCCKPPQTTVRLFGACSISVHVVNTCMSHGHDYKKVQEFEFESFTPSPDMRWSTFGPLFDRTKKLGVLKWDYIPILNFRFTLCIALIKYCLHDNWFGKLYMKFQKWT